MGDIVDEVRTILAHACIRDCPVRLVRGEDRRDANLVKDVFWSDATVDFGISDGTFARYVRSRVRPRSYRPSICWGKPRSTCAVNTRSPKRR